MTSNWGTSTPRVGSDPTPGMQNGNPQGPTEIAQRTAQQVQVTAAHLSDQAKQQIAGQLNSQKNRATSSLDSMAGAFRQTGRQLRDQGQDPVATFTERVADWAERLSSYLSERDVVALRREAEGLARTRPLAFLTGAFTIGWMGARFFKSSASTQQPLQTATPGASPAYGPTTRQSATL
jgi:hypothetical protein